MEPLLLAVLSILLIRNRIKMRMKVCSKCKEEKNVNEFYKQKRSKDGLSYRCRDCNKRYKIDNADKLKKQNKEYRTLNAIRIAEYRKNNTNMIRQRKKDHYRSNALYNTHHNQLTADEKPRLATDQISLEVRCKYCDNHFKPTNGEVIHRVQAINGKIRGDHNLYCSEGCKYSCPIYYQSKYSKDHKPSSYREIQGQLRRMALERDDWSCVK